MHETFQYLTSVGRGGAARAPGESVESRYDRKRLEGRVVVRDEYANLYRVFRSRGGFLEWYAGVPEAERCAHEVVFGHAPQRLKFDIDAPGHKLDAHALSAFEGGRECARGGADEAAGPSAEELAGAGALF